MDRLLVVAAAALLTTAAPALAANLIVNGDFESDPAPSPWYTQYVGGSSFTGWSVTGNDVLLIDRNYSEDGLVFNAQGGSNNAIDLTGSGNTGFTDGITQAVATEAGKTYRLVFFVGNASPTGSNAFSYRNPSIVNLSIDGGGLQSFTNSTDTPFAINWQRFSTTFVATGATSLAFSNGTPRGDSMAGLDTVSLVAIPEPATWAMLVLGFGLVGVASRRRITSAA
jgi:hypothetical protein